MGNEWAEEELLGVFVVLNSRMKDYFDLWVLLKLYQLDHDELRQALTATLADRKTALPNRLPLGLSDKFAMEAKKISQWNSFIKCNRLEAKTLTETIESIRQCLSFIFN